MYGMIHQALRIMALQHVQEAEWEALLRASDHAEPLFIGMEYYTDETTMELIHLVAGHLRMPMEDTLRQLGSVWIDFAGASEYGRILRMAGDDFVSFLESLDRMHASIRSNMPKAEMPSFELISVEDEELQVRYRSTRNGLAPMVQGILLATAERFDESVEVTYLPEDGGALFFIQRKSLNA